MLSNGYFTMASRGGKRTRKREETTWTTTPHIAAKPIHLPHYTSRTVSSCSTSCIGASDCWPAPSGTSLAKGGRCPSLPQQPYVHRDLGIFLQLAVPPHRLLNENIVRADGKGMRFISQDALPPYGQVEIEADNHCRSQSLDRTADPVVVSRKLVQGRRGPSVCAGHVAVAVLPQ